MIPYILTALGGYLIGSSVKQYAFGGQVQLLAPNGKPSNLTPEQYKLVRTPEFKAWFGDWENDPENASKVVDENGEPKVMFHYSPNEFTIFNPNYESRWINQRKEKVIWFGGNAKVISYSEGEKGFIYKCFLNVRKPINVDAKKYDEYDYYKDENGNKNYSIQRIKGRFVSELGSVSWNGKKNENDGVIFKNAWDNISLGMVIAVVEPNQIKLADGTNTTFDGSNPDIRYEQGGIVLEYLIHWTNRDGLEGIFKDKFLNEETSLTDSLKLPFDKENNMPFGIKLKNVPRKLLVKKGDTLLEKKHEYRTKRKLKIDEYFDGFVVRNNTNKNRLEKYLDNSFAFWDNDILRKYFREHSDYQIKIQN